MMNERTLEGRLTRAQRVEIAKDVIALCASRQRKIRVEQGSYLYIGMGDEDALLAQGGQLASKRLPKCEVCARGALFVASVDRHDKCDLREVRSLTGVVMTRTEDEWGAAQVKAIEAAFEGWGSEDPPLPTNPKKRLVTIMQNIVANNGEYKPGIGGAT